MKERMLQQKAEMLHRKLRLQLQQKVEMNHQKKQLLRRHFSFNIELKLKRENPAFIAGFSYVC